MLDRRSLFAATAAVGSFIGAAFGGRKAKATEYTSKTFLLQVMSISAVPKVALSEFLNSISKVNGISSQASVNSTAGLTVLPVIGSTTSSKTPASIPRLK